MYRNIKGKWFWQASAKLPTELKNALEKRWEKERRVLAGLLFLLAGGVVVCGLIWFSGWFLPMFFVAIIVVLLGWYVWNLKERHEATLRNVLSGGFGGYLYSDDGAILQSIMTPALRHYFSTRLPIQGHIKDILSDYLEEASIQEDEFWFDCVALGENSTAFLERQHAFELSLLDLAEHYAAYLGDTIGRSANFQEHAALRRQLLQVEYDVQMRNLVAD